MFKIGVGMSSLVETRQAIEEAIQRAKKQVDLHQIDWGLVFFTSAHISKAQTIWQIMKEQTACNCIAGCSTVGVLSNIGEIVGESGLCVMLGYTPELSCLGFNKTQFSKDAPSIPQQLTETLESFQGPNPVLLFFPDIYQNYPYNFLNCFNYIDTHPRVYGGGSNSDDPQQISVQIGPDGVSVSGASGLCFGNIASLNIGVTHSCTPIGDPLFITKTRENTILTLDGYPALDVYTTVAANLGFESLESASQQVLLSFPLDPEKPNFAGETSIVRYLEGIDPQNQGLVVPHIIKEGNPLSLAFRSSMTAEQDLYDMLERLKGTRSETPAFGVYFNCISRGESLYGRTNVDTQAIHDVLGNFPLIGFFSGYEMATIPHGLQLYSFSGVLLLIYES